MYMPFVTVQIKWCKWHVHTTIIGWVIENYAALVEKIFKVYLYNFITALGLEFLYTVD